MGKSRSKSRSELEWLRAENRHLKAEIKRLRKNVRVTEEIVEEITKDEPVEELRFKHCHECGKGIVSEIELSFMIIGTCDVCGHRETRRK